MHHLCNTDIVFEHSTLISLILYLFYDILAGLLYY